MRGKRHTHLTHGRQEMSQSKFDSIQAAVNHLISHTKMSDKSSGPALEAATRKHLTPKTLKKVNKQLTPLLKRCLAARLVWRTKHSVVSDCRMNGDKGQKERDMRNNNKIEMSVLTELQPLVDSIGSVELIHIIAKFHSIEQLTNAVEHTHELAKHYDLVTV